MRVFQLCYIVTHPLRKIVYRFYRFHPYLLFLIYSHKFLFQLPVIFLLLAGIYFFLKRQFVINCGLMFFFCKLWVDSEKSRCYYCVATVSFTNMTFYLWIGWALSLLRKIHILFCMENLSWLFFKIHTLWYSDYNWTVPTFQLLYSFSKDIFLSLLIDSYLHRWKICIWLKILMT